MAKKSLEEEMRSWGYNPDSRRKCLVRDCPNGADAGVMVGDLCAPCYEVLTTGKGSKPSRLRILTSVLCTDRRILECLND